MTGLEIAFIFGGVLGLFLGLWLGGRSVLWRMHHDDVEKAHMAYKDRKEKYLGRKLK
jgi:hypothetical protein